MTITLQTIRARVERVNVQWRRLLAARVALVLTLLCCGVLVLLDQGLDLMRGLVEDADLHLRSGDLLGPGAIRTWSQWTMLLVACLGSGLDAWFWSRMLFRLRGEAPPRWFRYLCRALAVSPSLAVIAAILRIGGQPGMRAVWIALLLLVAGLALLLSIAWRDALFRRWPLFRAPSRWLEPHAGSVEDPLSRADDVFAVASVASGLLLLLLLTVPLFPGSRTWVAWFGGAPGLTFAALGAIISTVSLFAWIAGRVRIDMGALGVAAWVAFSFWNDNHAVRVLDRAPPSRPSLERAIRIWDAGAGPGPLVLVATAGGASRAGYWTAAVLRALDDRTNGLFARRVFAISAVSGGSLGAVAFAAETRRRGRCYNRLRRLDFERKFVGGDYLAPAVGGMLFPDLLQRFLPLPRVVALPDRAQALEQSWEEGWRWAADHGVSGAGCGVGLPVGEHGLGRDDMAGDLAAIWADSLAGRAPWVPLVLVNGTSVETGKRIITAPVRVGSDVFEDSYDFFDLVHRPIRASTAILNGARFPVVSPAGTMRDDSGPHGRIVDGGYFENGGLETLYDLARSLRSNPLTCRRDMVIVEIDNAVAARRWPRLDGDIARYGYGQRAGEVRLPVVRQPTTGAPALSEVTSIIGGLYGTRSGRGVLAAKRISGLPGLRSTASDGGGRCPDGGVAGRVRRVTFNLGRLTRAGTAMSWALSASARDAIDLALLDPRRPSDREVLRRAMAASSNSPDWRLDQAAADIATASRLPGGRPLDCRRLAADQLAREIWKGAAPGDYSRCDLRSIDARDVGVMPAEAVRPAT